MGEPFVRRHFLRPLVIGSLALPMMAVRARARSLTFLVFFEWDSVSINAEGQRIISETAGKLGTSDGMGPITWLGIEGHADRSGPAIYNMHLSIRRAEAVLAHVLRLGAPVEKVSLMAHGEARPLVPTDDGVREMHNRRVELVLR